MEINNIKEMTTSELKSLVVKSAEEFYLNVDNGINIPDSIYDEMLDELKSREPDFNIFQNLNLMGKTIRHMGYFPLACKTKIRDLEKIVISIKFEDFKSIIANDNKITNDGMITMLASYQNGRLKYVMAIDLNTGNSRSSRLNILNYAQGILPNSLHKGSFRMILMVNTSVDENDQWGWNHPTCIGVVPEVEFDTADWAQLRMDIVKSEYFSNLTLVSSEVEHKYYQKYFKKLEDKYSQEPWLVYIMLADPSSKFTPKMDGCSSVTYYSNGKKDYTCSRSDDITGKDKTSYFAPFIPNEINFPGTLMLMHELVINLDFGFGWNSRQKANGLTNSKYSQDQLSLYATWVIYDAKDGDGNRVPLDVVKKVMYEAQKPTYLTEIDTEIVSLNILPRLFNNSPTTREWVNYILSTDNPINIVKLPSDWVENQIKNDRIIIFGVDKNYNKKVAINKDEYLIKSQGIIGPYRYVEVYYGDGTMYLTNRIGLGHKVRVCDEFIIEDADKFIDPNLQAYYHHSEGGTFLCDGVCLHERRLNKKTNKVEPFHNILKFDYNEVVDTTVNRIEWVESNFGTYIPTVVFETVLVEGSYLSKASVGGWAMLKKKRCGVGAKIKVVRVNSTIPQILSVVEPVDPELPVCPHCGRTLTEDKDLISGVFKCSDDNCPGKIEAKSWFLSKDHEWDPEKDILDRLARLVNIERYSKARKTLPKEYIDNILILLKEDKYDEFVDYVKRNVFINMSYNNLDGFNYGIKTAYRALQIKLGKKLIINNNSYEA